MQFRTEIDIPQFNFGFDHTQSALFVGSCFASNMAQRMHRAKFDVVCNPFGVLYNPLSVASMIDAALSGRTFGSDDLVQWVDSDLWCNFAFHGSFNSTDPQQALSSMNAAAARCTQALHNSELVVITFGTAWVYELADGGGVVSNCHKFASSTFGRRRLSHREIVECYDSLLTGALAGKNVIFTVSPIRHLKDGLSQSALSKATLLTAVAELVERHANAHYFAAFEIMTDDLRDYRFYAEDMVHPSAVAIEYIWQKFSTTLFDQPTRHAIDELERIFAAVAHRPFNPNSQQHRRFVEATRQRIEHIRKTYPKMDFGNELEALNNEGKQ